VIQRFSTRRQELESSFLEDRLQNAQSYDRIAGYFRSSLLDVAGEAIESVSGPIRIVCNSDLHPEDVRTARRASHAMRQEWCAGEPEQHADEAADRFARLYELLQSGKMEVRVLPDEKFGLVHGKAGVITLAGGTRTSYLGSANATKRAWQSNYELIWEDDSEEAVAWVEEEFEALWSNPHSVPLAESVIQDIGRISERSVYHEVEDWREDENPASTVIEAPVYREGFGLWEHQKYFVKRAFEAHKTSFGARYVLADMVGLGKTIQLALAAQLMALHDEGRVLILAPKTLLAQWQDELENMLGIPSAVWDSQKKRWIDEQGVEHPTPGYEGIAQCPRRIGLVSHGVITHANDEAKAPLLSLRYTCVIVDEAHNARRSNLGDGKAGEEPDPNNLLQFLLQLGPRTHSFLLATATPVQMYPVEAWDLLNILSQGRKHVLGSRFSHWVTDVEKALDVVLGKDQLPTEGRDLWRWMRDPLPPASEDRAFGKLRRVLDMGEDEAVAPGGTWENLRLPDHALIKRKRSDLAEKHHPFIRFIVRRTREYLETTPNPDTGEPYLDSINVELLGEEPEEAIPLPGYMQDAYDRARDFCELIGRRMNASGFMKTQLLRRMGSTIHAGRLTTERILRDWEPIPEEEAEDEDEAPNKSLSPDEEECLNDILTALSENVEQDPKYQRVTDLLFDEGWLQRGCIIFSQYYESIYWLASQLSDHDLPSERIGVYGARDRSGIMKGGVFEQRDRDELKGMIRSGEIRLLLGTESASEGLNLQRLSTLINFDLPWNPTRLEQRKGRIQRIGQVADTIYIYNMRYRGSVEDRVHELLSERLEQIHNLFGQIPDMLEDAWVNVALNEIEEAKKTIGEVPEQHPFEMRYEQIASVDWESCAEVLADDERRRTLSEEW